MFLSSFAMLSLEFSRPPRRNSPQAFLVTAAVVAAAVVMCLNSLLFQWEAVSWVITF